MPAWIINLGTELCIGRVINTNGAWLASRLTLLGASVRRIIVAPDEEADAVGVIAEALRSARIVVTTGGLGPTYDDRTAEFIAKATGRRLVLNRDALEMIKRRYESVGGELTPERVKMAYMPEGAEPIPNPVGTAPGILLRLPGAILAALPGVPREMKEMFDNYVVPVLRGMLPPTCVVEKCRVVKGVMESAAAPVIRRIAKKYPSVYVKSHPMGVETESPSLRICVLLSRRNCREAEEEAEHILEELVTSLRSLRG